MTWHLEHAVASVQAFSVASQQAILLLDALAPLWRQPTSGQGVFWSLLDCLSQVGNSLCRGLCVQVGSIRCWHPMDLQTNPVTQCLAVEILLIKSPLALPQANVVFLLS